ncbi:MAG: molybdopterin-dependent oxidoreductase [Gammaproteobacteria bacterium]|nr:molybdopterin-dependent oxidoreductase [Gammaproteobacteria bacterium]
MKQIKTFCRICEPSCGLVAHVKDNKITRLSPDKEHPVTKGFACHKGLATLEIHQDEDRLNYPLKRNDAGITERIDWRDAVAEIASRIADLKAKYGDESLASFTGNPLAFNSLAGPAIGSFMLNNKIRKNFSSGTQDCTNKFAASEAVFGSNTIHPIPDIDNTDFLLIFGANPRISHMSFLSIPDPMDALRSAAKRGADIRFVDPRKNESISGVGTHLAVKPDTDVYLMAALLNHLFANDLVNHDSLSEHADNIDELREFISAYSPEKVAAIVGISAEEIKSLAEAIAGAKSAAFHMSTGVNMGRQGTLAYCLLFMLSLVTGNLDKPGGNIYSRGFYPGAKAGRVRGDIRYEETPFGDVRRIRGSLPANLLADMILTDDNPIRGLIIISGNPLLSIGSSARLQKAFEQLEFILVIDIYPSATSEYADYVLPATDMFERADVNICGLGLQKEPFVQYTDFIVPPAAERKPEWWILQQLEAAQGFDTATSELDDYQAAIDKLGLFDRIDHMMRQSDLDLETVRKNSTVVLPPVKSGNFFDEIIQTDTGRVNCCPESFTEARALCADIFDELESENADQLKVISRRTNYMINSWFHNIPSLKRPSHQTNPLYIHPEDARRHNLGDGSQVRISNRYGEVTTTVALDESLRPGTVAITHGWGYRGSAMKTAAKYPGCNANNLLPSGIGSFEKVSNQSFMTGIPVEVEAC